MTNTEHRTDVTLNPTTGSYRWSCSCGDGSNPVLPSHAARALARSHEESANAPQIPDLPELDRLRAQVAELADQLHKANAQVKSLEKATTAYANENAELRKVVDAATYEYADMLCLDRECDHDTDSDDGPCPFVETRYATAAEILAVKALLMSTDGDALGDDDEIPVGEIRRVLGEAREAVAK